MVATDCFVLQTDYFMPTTVASRQWQCDCRVRRSVRVQHRHALQVHIHCPVTLSSNSIGDGRVAAGRMAGCCAHLTNIEQKYTFPTRWSIRIRSAGPHRPPEPGRMGRLSGPLHTPTSPAPLSTVQRRVPPSMSVPDISATLRDEIWCNTRMSSLLCNNGNCRSLRFAVHAVVQGGATHAK